MEKTIRKLISNSIRLRAWTTSSNYVAMNIALQNTAYSSQLVPDVNTECKETKSSVENVNKLNPAGLNNVFTKDDMLQNNKEVYTQETFKIVKDLLEQIKHGDTDKNCSQKLSILCERLQKDAKLLSINQMITCLYVFKSLQISFKSNIVQILLQYIRISVNNLSIKQMLSLYRVMSEEDNVFLVRALKKAFAFVFYNQIHVELNRHDMNNLEKALQLSINLQTNNATRYIIDILSTNLNIIQIQHVKSIFHSLCTLSKLNKTSSKVLSKVEEVIMANPTDLNVKDINILLFHMMQTFINGKTTQFYNVKIVSALCNSVTSRNVSFYSRMKVLEKLNRMYYCDITLLDYITVECIKNHDCLKNCNLNEVFQLIKGYTFVNDKPQGLEILEPQLINYVMNTNYSLSSLVAIAFRLLSLGCYYPELYEKVFTSYYCTNDDHKTYMIKSFVLKLHQALQYYHPEYNGMTLSLTMIDEIAETQKFRNNTIFTSLSENFKEVIGDVQYIKLNMKTKFGYFIDCAAVLQSDGSPMVINQDNNNIEFVEDLMLPPGCRKLIIFVLPKRTYTYNMQNLHSTWKLHLKIMEATLGTNVFHLNPYVLEQMSFPEKNKYIQQVIGLTK